MTHKGSLPAASQSRHSTRPMKSSRPKSPLRHASYTAPMTIIAKTGPAFGPEQATLEAILGAGAVVVLVAVVVVTLIALIRLVFAP